MSLEKNIRRKIKKRRVLPVQIHLQVVHQERKRKISTKNRTRIQKRYQSPHQEALQKTQINQSLPARTFKVEFCLAIMTRIKKVTKKIKNLLKRRIKLKMVMVSNEVTDDIKYNISVQ